MSSAGSSGAVKSSMLRVASYSSISLNISLITFMIILCCCSVTIRIHRQNQNINGQFSEEAKVHEVFNGEPRSAVRHTPGEVTLQG